MLQQQQQQQQQPATVAYSCVAYMSKQTKVSVKKFNRTPKTDWTLYNVLPQMVCGQGTS